MPKRKRPLGAANVGEVNGIIHWSFQLVSCTLPITVVYVSASIVGFVGNQNHGHGAIACTQERTQWAVWVLPLQIFLGLCIRLLQNDLYWYSSHSTALTNEWTILVDVHADLDVRFVGWKEQETLGRAIFDDFLLDQFLLELDARLIVRHVDICFQGRSSVECHVVVTMVMIMVLDGRQAQIKSKLEIMVLSLAAMLPRREKAHLVKEIFVK